MKGVSNIHNNYFSYYCINFQLILLAWKMCIVVSSEDIRDVHMTAGFDAISAIWLIF